MATSSTRNPRIKALGEVALRVNDLEAMQRFYEDVIGLELMKRFSHAAFFKITDGYAGHTQVFVLFDRSNQPDFSGVSAESSTIDHIAFSITLTDFAAEKNRLEQLGLHVETAEHVWVHWRSLYVKDPEGNEVELVCYDASVQ